MLLQQFLDNHRANLHAKRAATLNTAPGSGGGDDPIKLSDLNDDGNDGDGSD
jgi:hypothetical protein